MPSEAKHILCEYLGQYDAMDHFKGRKEIFIWYPTLNEFNNIQKRDNHSKEMWK